METEVVVSTITRTQLAIVSQPWKRVVPSTTYISPPELSSYKLISTQVAGVSAFLHCLSLKCLIIVSVYSAYLADLVVSVLIYIIDYVTGTGRGIGNSSREQYIRAYNTRMPEQSVSHSHRHMAELLQLEHAIGGKLQHLHRWFWDRHVHRASQEACGESVCTILYYRAFSLTS